MDNGKPLERAKQDWVGSYNILDQVCKRMCFTVGIVTGEDDLAGEQEIITGSERHYMCQRCTVDFELRDIPQNPLRNSGK